MMFTGIVEEVGKVRYLRRSGKGYDLALVCNVVTDDTRLGDSIAVNGVCLTVTNLSDDGFTVGLSPETRSRTNLAVLKSGDQANLERSVTPTTRLGGHFVQGHIDDTGRISQFQQDEDALWITIQADPQLMRYIVPKGYICLDGASLTVVDVGDDWFTVTLIAYTQQHIILPQQQVGYSVNIEVDVLGKYVEKMLNLQHTPPSSNITLDFLTEHGYD
ncbi:MAG: riboflavin synthase [Anaerolineae bacterium]